MGRLGRLGGGSEEVPNTGVGQFLRIQDRVGGPLLACNGSGEGGRSLLRFASHGKREIIFERVEERVGSNSTILLHRLGK